MSIKKRKYVLVGLLFAVFIWASVAYADSPKDHNGIYICSSYTYDYFLKTFNCQSDGPRTYANVTFGNTTNLTSNEIVPSYVWIRNDHSSNTYAYYFSIGYDNDYVLIDDIYYRSISDTMAPITQINEYQSDGTIDTTIRFGDPVLGEGLLDPGEEIHVYIDWKYVGSTDDWYYWAPEFGFLGTNYHYLAGLSTGQDFLTFVPEVGTTDNIELLGDGVDTNLMVQSQLDSIVNQQNVGEDPFEEWREIQYKKKKGLLKNNKYVVVIKNSNGETVLVTDSIEYKKNKKEIEKRYNLIPSK